MSLAVDDLPLLGEPLPVELANTRYGTGSDTIDFLGSPELVDAWLRHADPSTATFAPLRPRDVPSLRALRDAVRMLVDHTIAGTEPPAAAVTVVNDHSARAPVRLQLGRSPAGWCVVPSPSAAGVAGLLGALAHATVVLLASDDAGRLRRCANPECSMTFVQHHGRRRWCHDGCGHRLRQAAYYRRTRGLGDGRQPATSSSA